MKALKRAEVIKMLVKNGFQSVRNGPHEIFKNSKGFSIALPYHKEISPGTLRDVIKGIKRGLAA